MSKIEQIARTDNGKARSLVKLADICNACMFSNIEQQDKIAAWLKDQKKLRTLSVFIHSAL